MALKIFKKEKYLWLMCLLPVAYFIIFAYIPIINGFIMSVIDYNPIKGMFGSSFIGLKYFRQFFNLPSFWRLITNTIKLSLYALMFGFPAPIIIALVLNECHFRRIKRVAQTIVYMPHFISTVVIVGILVNFVNPTSGIVNEFIKMFGGKPINFMGEPQWFRPLYVISNMWQFSGWGSIIYLAALSAIDPQLYESAIIDGANRFKTLIHITIPSILPTIIIMLILRMGSLFSVGFEKIILMYSPGIYETADVISTYVFRRGILQAQFGFGSAVGLFNSVINAIFLVVFNWVSRRVSETSLW